MQYSDFEYWKRAQDSVAQGALTNSKHPSSHVFGVYPTHVKGGSLGYLYATNGKRYRDYICGLGSNLFGYSPPGLAQRLTPYLTGGFSHSFPTVHEVETAERLKDMFFFVDKFKFLKSGSEACNAAIKIARAYQGVRDGNEKVFEVFANEVCRRFSQEIEGAANKIQGNLQGLCEGVSETTTHYGNKTQGSKEVFPIGEGEGDRKEILADSPSKDSGEWETASLLHTEAGSLSRDNSEEILRGLWGKENARSSRRLFETIRREVALSQASRRGAQRFLVLSDNYHGIGDKFISLVAPHAGVLEDISILPLIGNEDLIDIAAAVIIEPVVTDASTERMLWLQDLRKRCTKAGTVLIFDEIINGFRFETHSVSTATGVLPDLICLGKAMANGLPLAAVGGKKEIMDGDYFVSSTYAGEVLSLISCQWTIDQLLNTSVFKIEKLWEQGGQFITKFNKMGQGQVWIEGYPTRGVFKGEPLTRALFFQEACKAGFLFGPSFFYSFANREFDFEFFTFFKDFIDRLFLGLVKLEGKMPESPFAERVRKNG